MSELKLITPRRNFLIRALGFTAPGATLPIGLVAADDPMARIERHQACIPSRKDECPPVHARRVFAGL